MRKLIALMAIAILVTVLFWYDRDLRHRERDIRKYDENGVNPGADLGDFDDE